MIDLTDWKITELERRGNKATVWYFKVTKPDGKRHVAGSTDYYGQVWSVKAIPNSAVWAQKSHGASEFYVKAMTEAGAIRKIMRFVESLAKDWNTRAAIKEAGVKQVTFSGRKPEVIGVDRQLESGTPVQDTPPPKEKKKETLEDFLAKYGYTGRDR